MMKHLFWANDMEKAAAESQRRFPGEAKATLELADEICENRFSFRGHWEMERTHIPVAFGENIDWGHVENGDAEWTYAFNRHSFLLTLGKAWRYSGNRRYAEAAARLWARWIGEVPFNEAAKQSTWRSIETGLRCESWLRALALLEGSAAVDGALLQSIQQSLQVHAKWLLEAHGEFQKLSNWGVLQDHGLFLLGLAFNEPQWQSTAAARLELELHNQVMADGSHWEQSPLYHCEVLHCCLDTLLAARRAGVALPDGMVKRTHAMARALAAMLRPDGKLICQSDSDEVDARDLLALAALLFEDGGLKAAAAGGLYEENLWDFCAEDMARYRELKAEKAAGGSAALPHSGNYMLWDGKGPGAGFMHFRCGALGSGHGHADLLHVDLVYQGESVLCDSGRYTYVNSARRRRLKSPPAHNCVTVDGRDFSVATDSWGYGIIAEPLKGQHYFTPQADYAEGAHLGYFHLGVLHRRRVLRLGGGLWLLWDSFWAGKGEAHSYRHYYHFGPGGQLEAKENGAVYRGKACAASMALCGRQVELAIEQAEVSREYNRLESAWRLSASHRSAGFCSLAAVLALGEKPPELTVEMLPVAMAARQEILPPDKAQALAICHDGRQSTVILCHSEVISQVDRLTANGCTGYGKVLVFREDLPLGLCLAW